MRGEVLFNEGKWSDWIRSQERLFTRKALLSASAVLTEKFFCSTKEAAGKICNPVFCFPDDCVSPELEKICGHISGYDLPCLLGSPDRSGHKGVVMFCAQDPLRHDESEGIRLGTFFGIDYAGLRNQRRHYGVVWQLILRTIRAGYDVWVTDANKLYCKDATIPPNLLALSYATLDDEVQSVQPARIVAFGNAAYERLKRHAHGYPVRHVRHPANWLSKAWAEERRTTEIEDSVDGRFQAKVDRYWADIWQTA